MTAATLVIAVIALAGVLRLAVWAGIRGGNGGAPYHFPSRRMGIALAVLAVLYFGALFGGGGRLFVEAPAIVEFDRAVNALFAGWRQEPIILYGFLWITILGAGPALTAVAATASAFLWAGGRARHIIPLWVAFIGAQATTWLGKYAIGRERPSFIEAATATAPSFPSGHATGALALFGFLAYLFAHVAPSRRARIEIVFWPALLIALIGLSRCVLSVHHPSDVIAGFAVGAFWLCAGIAHAERARRAAAAPVG